MNKEKKNKEPNKENLPVNAVPATQPETETSAPGPKREKGPKKPFARKREGVASEFVEKVIAINRVTKVTKGGKRLAFSALVVVGDTKGRVGYGLQKASEVAYAIKKSLSVAKKSMIRVHLAESTIPHEVIGVCGASAVMLKPASEGTGVIAAGPVRAVCDSVGIRNILTKCHRSNNPINVVKATFDGLTKLKARKQEFLVPEANAPQESGEIQNAAARTEIPPRLT